MENIVLKNGDRASWANDSFHLAKSRQSIIQTDQALGTPDQIERAVGKRQTIGVCHDGRCGTGRGAKTATSLLQIRRTTIDRHKPTPRTKPLGHKSRVKSISARNIEDAHRFRQIEKIDASIQFARKDGLVGGQRFIVSRRAFRHGQSRGCTSVRIGGDARCLASYGKFRVANDMPSVRPSLDDRMPSRRFSGPSVGIDIASQQA